MDIQIRTCTEEDMDRFLITTEAAFGQGVDEKERARMKKNLEPERCFAAWDGDAMVGAGANYSLTLSIPGGELPAAGVTMIGVLPTHRRRGILTKMMARLADDAAAHAEPVAILWASETSIYQRFGYGPATKQVLLDAEKNRLLWLDPSPIRGSVRLLSEDETLKTLPDIYERVRLQTPGSFARSSDWWSHHRLKDHDENSGSNGPLFRAALEIDGRAEAYALYRVEQFWDAAARNKLHVIEALGATDEATREIWKYLFSLDLIETVRSWWLPIDHPLFLMVAEPPRLGMRLINSLWLQVLDVQAALEARSYAAADSVVFEISQGPVPAAQGRWRLDAQGSTPAVGRTDDDPDVQLSIQDLGGMYLGGCTFAQLLAAGRGCEVTDGAAARFDALFHTARAPYCTEIF
jgi:predicted acetyltransferase